MDKTLETRVKYPKQAFKSIAAKVWKELFTHTKDTGDVAFWCIELPHITLSLRDSGVDESNPRWKRVDYVTAMVDNFDEMASEGDEEPEALYDAIYAWAVKGIMEAFHSASVQKKYQRFISDGNNFAIVSTDSDDSGLSASDISLLWTQKKHFTVSRIWARQKAARDKRIAKEEAAPPEKKVAKPVDKAMAKGMNQRLREDIVNTWAEFLAGPIGFQNVAQIRIMPEGGSIWVESQHSTERKRHKSRYLKLIIAGPWWLGMDREREDFAEYYRETMEQRLLKTFLSARIQKKFKRYNPENMPFAIMTSTEKINLHEAGNKVLWSNDPKFTAARIRAQRKAAITKQRKVAKAKKK